MDNSINFLKIMQKMVALQSKIHIILSSIIIPYIDRECGCSLTEIGEGKIDSLL